MLLGWLQRGRRELSGSPSLKCVRQIATEIDKSEVGMYIGARRLHGAVTRARHQGPYGPISAPSCAIPDFFSALQRPGS